MRALPAAVGNGVAAGVVEGQPVVYVDRIEASAEILDTRERLSKGAEKEHFCRWDSDSPVCA